jgi:hypothetical protein
MSWGWKCRGIPTVAAVWHKHWQEHQARRCCNETLWDGMGRILKGKEARNDRALSDCHQRGNILHSWSWSELRLHTVSADNGYASVEDRPFCLRTHDGNVIVSNGEVTYRQAPFVGGLPRMSTVKRCTTLHSTQDFQMINFLCLDLWCLLMGDLLVTRLVGSRM